jgi:hypothetical protein
VRACRADLNLHRSQATTAKKIIFSNTTMRFRKLRIAFSAACLIACVLLIVLWVRSYQWVEAIRLTAAPNGGAIQCLSIPGRFAIGQLNAAKPWSFFRMSAAEWRDVIARTHTTIPSETWGGILRNPAVDQVFVPYWMLVLLSVAIASAPWLRWRFTIRTLLIATTLVAGMLGLIVWAVR